jgi:hypothetical protein
MEITLYRDQELRSELRQLPAETYNAALILLRQNSAGNVFVPIRSMQYLAIIDNEEIVFVDSIRKSRVAIAWTDFRPQERSGLNDAVSYVARYYNPDAQKIMQRLQGEFLTALRTLRSRQAKPEIAKVIMLSAKPVNRQP